MKSSFLHSFKRMRSVDTAIILLCDLALIPLFWLLFQLFLSWISKVSFLLSNVVLDKTGLATNVQLAAYNSELLRQAGLNTSYMVVLIIVLFSIGWSILTYLQWGKVLHKTYSFRNALQFVLTQSVWLILMIMLAMVSLFFLLEQEFMNPFLLVWFVVVFHFTVALNFGLFETIKKRSSDSKWEFLKQHCRAAFHHGFDNLTKLLAGLVFLIVICVLCVLLSGVSYYFSLPLYGFFFVFFIIGLCWWRYFMAGWVLGKSISSKKSATHKKKRR